MSIKLKDPWDRQLTVIANRLACDPDTALYRSLSLALTITKALEDDSQTKIMLRSRGKESWLDHRTLYDGWSNVPPDVGLPPITDTD